MLFKSFYRYFYLLAMIVAFIDYIVTNIGITWYPVWFEANPLKRLLFHFMNPYLASSIVFMITFFFTFGSYWLLRDFLNQKPYSLSMKDVGNYLWNLSEIKIRDLSIFACLALVLVFITQHLIGAFSWIFALTS